MPYHLQILCLVPLTPADAGHDRRWKKSEEQGAGEAAYRPDEKVGVADQTGPETIADHKINQDPEYDPCYQTG